MESRELESDNPSTVKIPILPVLAAWLVPGGGHLWQRRWGRGALLLVSIGTLFLVGVTMQGRLFQLVPGNFVEMMGFLSDCAAGLLFLVTRSTGYNPGELPSPASDFGTKFILVAGLLNVLCILDAYDIAVGKKD